MTIKEKKCKFIPALFLILLAMGTSVLLFLSNLLPHANNRFEAGPVTMLDTHWTGISPRHPGCSDEHASRHTS